MYFYTFSTEYPYNILRVSHAFIPPTHGKYLLAFPMGIAPVNGNKFAVSYGEADKFVKIMTISTNEIEKMMLNYLTLDPIKYKFKVL